DLLSYQGAIVVTNLAGAVRARVTDGDIQIDGLRSARVDASCTQGNVSFSGEVLPSGSYTLKSFSGRVDAILPADADFKLSASSFRGGMDLGAFQMKFDKRSHQLGEASHGAGSASISLWTQEGSSHLHRKPRSRIGHDPPPDSHSVSACAPRHGLGSRGPRPAETRNYSYGKHQA